MVSVFSEVVHTKTEFHLFVFVSFRMDNSDNEAKANQVRSSGVSRTFTPSNMDPSPGHQSRKQKQVFKRKQVTVDPDEPTPRTVISNLLGAG